MKLKRVNEFPHEIMLSEESPCISIYMPTHRDSQDWKQDRVRFRNLITKVENSLENEMKQQEIEEILEPLYEVLEYPYFWNEVADGLGVLLNRKEAIYYRLNRKVEEYASVANSFYIRPLIRNYQSYDKYHVLGLSQDEFRLYEGNRYSFEEIKLPEDIITKKEDLLDDDRKGRVISFGTYKGGGTVSIHGHNTKQEGLERDRRKFFRYVDYEINERYSKPENTPLILISLPENQGEFRSISKNRNLLDKGINKSPVNIDIKSLNEDVWEVIEPIYLNKTEELLARYSLAKSELIASMDLGEIAYGCESGRVDTLIVEADRALPGYYDKEAGEIVEGKIDTDGMGDLINQLSILTVRQGGEVIVLPKERFPEESGCVAIFRY